MNVLVSHFPFFIQIDVLHHTLISSVLISEQGYRVFVTPRAQPGQELLTSLVKAAHGQVQFSSICIGNFLPFSPSM